MGTRPFRSRNSSKSNSSAPSVLPVVFCPCSTRTNLTNPLRIDEEVLTNILECDFPWREVYYTLMNHGLRSQQACYSIGGVKELLFLSAFSTAPLGINHAFVCQAWAAAIERKESYSYLMGEIAIASCHLGFNVERVDNSELFVTDEMIRRFNEAHAAYFPHSRVWPHRYKQYA